MRRYVIASLSAFVCLITLGFAAFPVSAQTSSNVVLYAAETPVKVGNWLVVADSTAAGGSRLANPNLNAAKASSPLPSPTSYFEMTFRADAGRPYRLWLRGKAESNSYNNDSAFVQFSDSLDAGGSPVYRVGTSSATSIILEDCKGCGLSGWGWQDNKYGAGALGQLVYFARTGLQTIRVQSREDGLSIDQIVLSPVDYVSSAPGATKRDVTLLARNDGTLQNQPPQVDLTAYVEDGATQSSGSAANSTPEVSGAAPLAVRFGANASDADGSIVAYHWDFGDGQSSSSQTGPLYTYLKPGSYVARLTVTDDLGQSATDTLSIVVAAPTGATTLKVLSWNVHKSVGTDDINSPDRIADYINRVAPDVAMLCELVDRSTASPGKSLADLLRRKSGVTWYYHWVPKYAGCVEGNLILSKRPFESTGGKYLNYQRSVAQATISVNNRSVDIFVTHLAVESSSWRWTEANELISYAVGFGVNRIIGGDFNASHSSNEIELVASGYYDTWGKAIGDKTAVAYADNRVSMDTRTRRGRIDYLFYSRNSSNLTLKSAQVPDTRNLSNTKVNLLLGTADDKGVRPSDHNQVVATFEVN